MNRILINDTVPQKEAGIHGKMFYTIREVTFNRTLFKEVIGVPISRRSGKPLRRVRGGVTRLLTRQGLMKIKTRALRQNIWFKVTSRLERGIVDLAIRCLERIRSPVLTRTISEIIRKILKTLEKPFLKLAEEIGAEIAERVCGIAVAWGNKTASSWKYDYSFTRFLGVNRVNVQMGHK